MSDVLKTVGGIAYLAMAWVVEIIGEDRVVLLVMG